MTLYAGSLFERLAAYRAGSSTRGFGLLVIDERGALDYGYQVWTSPKLIEFSSQAEQAWLATRGIKA